MAEQSPDALRWLGSRVAPDLGGVLSGIIGDKAHTRGYHRGRNYVPSTDYSVKLTEDKKGSADYACAIDMSFDTAKMKLYTGRLRAAADRNDPRLKYVREFYGTLDGKTVYGRTHAGSSDATWEKATSDKSHLWHIHISILRAYSNNRSVMQGILDILRGVPLPKPNKPGDDEMTKDEVKAAVREVLSEARPFQASGPRNRLKETGWRDLSIRELLDYIFETTSHNEPRHNAALSAIGGVDEAVMDQLSKTGDPAQTAMLLKQVLGDQADAVFRAGLGLSDPKPQV